MCNWLACGSAHDVIAVAVAVVIGLAVPSALIWVIETCGGGQRRG